MKNNEMNVDSLCKMEDCVNKIQSLLNCMESALVDDINYTRADVLNLISVAGKLVEEIKAELDLKLQ